MSALAKPMEPVSARNSSSDAFDADGLVLVIGDVAGLLSGNRKGGCHLPPFHFPQEQSYQRASAFPDHLNSQSNQNKYSNFYLDTMLGLCYISRDVSTNSTPLEFLRNS